MKKLTVFILGSILVVSVLGAHLLGVSARRGVVAQSWSTEGVEVIATGALNTNMHVTLTPESQRACDMLIDEIVADPDLSKKIAAYGFSTVQCGSHISNLK